LLNTKESAAFPSSVSKPLLSLLNTLLQRNPDLRCKSWTQVKQHEFFKVVHPVFLPNARAICASRAFSAD
jgi:hypothetical protein